MESRKKPGSKVIRIMFIIIETTFMAFDRTQYYCFEMGSYLWKGFPVAQMVKNLPVMWEDPGSIPGLGRSPGEGHGNPLQHSCLENPMDREAWWATVRKVTELDMIEWLSSSMCESESPPIWSQSLQKWRTNNKLNPKRYISHNSKIYKYKQSDNF